MERRQILKTAGILATGGVTGLAGCSSSGNGDGGGEPTTTEPQETAGGSGDSNTVMMVTEGSEYYFDPIGLFIESGETVTFEIQSGSHSATAYKEGTSSASVTRIPESAETFNSETLSEQGATYEHTFETTGTYDYFCIPHKTLGMVGRIVVGEPGGPAEGSMPPDGDVPESQTIVDQGSVSYSSFSG
ncbi:plastocyanin/azurin family copper-binding protein [Haloarcula sp. S1AR25-5A]|jgi:plastocyanin|uniref:Plastocyanin/azurin family copper-binding protein n=1 Tax=Haloarcula terrestris TaxID=2950533 RepID=A0AAE4JHY2_9EURY|nr:MULTISPECIES: plastocyanin/azurin family copper-binding protein [Haloarculaceae]MDS0223218.1 plastocyanin/azurin family copper-binding protein [Haloarcula terrestris]MDS0280095.1 plastocyanin/azurin family copper-binding protein [Halomicroarcula sp. S1AR25-4]